MCGIAGWVDLGGTRPPNGRLIRAMTAALAHRGPDGDGFFETEGVAFGHRRLAIIDLSGGAQPMSDAGGEVTITFNGEIYNYRALRADLAARGHRFRTDSDTEVILAGWREWGPDIVERLHGMFAFGLWDERRQSLFLARDRMGEKPLYYAHLADGTLIFGSELKALKVHPGLDCELDPEAVEEFFALGYIADPRTIHRGVRRLPAAHTLLVERGRAPVTRPYWDFSGPVAMRGTLDDFADALLDRFSRSVSAQLMSDVPLGAFLSGGVDSSATVATMARLTGGPVNAFTIGFDDPAFDETAPAAEVAALYGADHRMARMTGDETDLIAMLPGVYDEPFGDSSALPTYHLARLARRHVAVALSGDGGDELFAGYRRYRFHAREERMRGLLPTAIRAPLLGGLAGLYPQLDRAPRWLRARHTLRELSLDSAEGLFWNVSVTDDDQRRRLFSGDLRHRLGGYSAVEIIRRELANSPYDDPVTTAQYVDLKTWLPGDILTKVDRASMACGLEVRVPMLDHEFADWAMSLPRHARLRHGAGKRVLKRAFARLLPAGFVDRPKRGFSVPLASWFRGGMGEAFRAEALGPDGLARCGLFDQSELKKLCDEHRSGARDHGRILWQLSMFQGFLKLTSVSHQGVTAVTEPV